jgi:hypothetical protein
MAARKITEALYNTVSAHKNIANVYFTKDNKYYYNAFTVNEKQKDGSTKPVLYARTKDITTPVQGQTLGETTTIGIPETAIVETISRADLLKMTPEPPAQVATN